jgi:hypothetical protein
MGTFFPKGRPKAGVALSFPGVYDGIAHMDRVLWNMSVIGGYIDRTNRDNWVIVPSESGVEAGAANEFDTATPQDVGSAGVVGSSGNVSHSDHVHRAPHWNQMQIALSNTNLTSDTDATDNLIIGTDASRWYNIYGKASNGIRLQSGAFGSSEASVDLGDAAAGGVTVFASSDVHIEADADTGTGFAQISVSASSGGADSINLETTNGDITLNAGDNIILSGLPASDTGLVTGEIFTQTAAELGDTGNTTKVVCIK